MSARGEILRLAHCHLDRCCCQLATARNDLEPMAIFVSLHNCNHLLVITLEVGTATGFHYDGVRLQRCYVLKQLMPWHFLCAAFCLLAALSKR